MIDCEVHVSPKRENWFQYGLDQSERALALKPLVQTPVWTPRYLSNIVMNLIYTGLILSVAHGQNFLLRRVIMFDIFCEI